MQTILKNSEVLNKALAILAVENTLLEIGNPAYEYVVDMLNKEYHCGLTDCYEHPEYLTSVLKKLYGDSAKDIVKSIKKQLNEFSHKKLIARFVEEINQ